MVSLRLGSTLAGDACPWPTASVVRFATVQIAESEECQLAN